MRKKPFIPFNRTFYKRIITNYAKIKEVIWLEGRVYRVNIRSYINPNKDYYDNDSFTYPNIPHEIIDHIISNRNEYSTI